MKTTIFPPAGSWPGSIPESTGPAAPSTGRPPDASADGPKARDRLEQTCAQMESLFLHQLIKSMRAAIPRSDLLGENKGEELYRELLDVELSKTLSQDRGFGLKEMLLRQLGRFSEENDEKKESKDSSFFRNRR